MASALKYWELDNNIELVDPKRNGLYAFDSDAYKRLIDSTPWRASSHYFKRVRISAVALIKMVMHARSGGSLEVMGLMQGYIEGDSFIVTDAFRLPVEGTETRVNAQNEAEEYMVEYLGLSREQGARQENVVGWYHSHPGYGCWLSGIDVGTQQQQQQFNEPFLAVVIDPDRTINSGKVEIGAFRTLPPKPEGAAATATAAAAAGEAGPSKGAPEGDPSESRAAGSSSAATGVPLDKATEFGAHAEKYYSLEVSHFKSTLDTHLLEVLWDKYWIQTLSQSSLFSSRDFSNKQLRDLAGRVGGVDGQLGRVQGAARPGNPFAKKPVDNLMEKLAAESGAVSMREQVGLMALDVKANVFGGGFAGQNRQDQPSR